MPRNVRDNVSGVQKLRKSLEHKYTNYNYSKNMLGNKKLHH